MEDQDHRVVSVATCSGQDRVQARAEAAQLAERVEDAGRPVDAGDEPALLRLRAPRECGLDDPGDVVLALHHAAILKGFHLAASGSEALSKMLLANGAEHHRLHPRRTRLPAR